ncbi:MAG: hypothetical protein M1827_007135 [Pycnora praestabilis]|nr:MAG: hypothetical protein M1827_007135 [Pycnora praestabilis]
MKSQQILSTLSFLVTLTSARPVTLSYVATSLQRREVPQEHSHNKFLATVRTSLATDNPANIQDPVFGLLGNAAAAAGQGTITDTNCLQQATADQAFTNAKAAGDVAGMTAALVYRALERNTGTVGGASAACTSIKAVNPEIAALSQHQDAASAGAAAINKAVALTLAKQISSIGGDPQTAIQSGTFAPGSTTDSTGKGNTCDDANDTNGCIFTDNLLVPDISATEAAAAGGGGPAPSSNASTPAAANTPAIPAAPASAGAVDAAPAAVPAAVANSSSVAAPAPAPAAAGGALDFGTGCSNPGIVFGAGFDGRKEDSFEPADTTQFTHGSALNIGVITGFISDRFKSNCKASAAAIAAAAKGQAATTGLTGQAAADAWNSALGLTNVASASTPAAPTTAVGPSTLSTAPVSPAPLAAAASPNTTTNSTTPATAAVPAAAAGGGALSFGSCTNPTIVFGAGFDGRTEDSFEPVNEADFNHGSADNIGVITNFICGQLGSKCQANAAAVAACTKGEAAAAKLTGQAAADAFNAAITA